MRLNFPRPHKSTGCALHRYMNPARLRFNVGVDVTRDDDVSARATHWAALNMHDMCMHVQEKRSSKQTRHDDINSEAVNHHTLDVCQNKRITSISDESDGAEKKGIVYLVSENPVILANGFMSNEA